MPVFLASLLGGLVEVAGTLVGRVLISLGLGYTVFTGVDTGIAWAKAQALSNLGQMSATSVQVASALNVGTVISILFSALTARLALMGLTGGTIKKLIQK